MITFSVKYGSVSRDVTFYHRFDLSDEQVVTVDYIRNNQKGDYRNRFLEFNDGSGWYVRIRLNRGLMITTDSGNYYLGDIVVCSSVKYPGTQYSGVYSCHEPFDIRRASRSEHWLACKILRGEHVKFMTYRIKRLIMDKLRTILEGNSVTTEWVIDKLKNLVDARGTIGDKHKVLMDLLKILNPEVALLGRIDNDSGKQIPMFNQFNQVNIHSEKRSGSPKEIKSFIEAVKEIAPDQFALMERADGGDDESD